MGSIEEGLQWLSEFGSWAFRHFAMGEDNLLWFSYKADKRSSPHLYRHVRLLYWLSSFPLTLNGGPSSTSLNSERVFFIGVCVYLPFGGVLFLLLLQLLLLFLLPLRLFFLLLLLPLLLLQLLCLLLLWLLLLLLLLLASEPPNSNLISTVGDHFLRGWKNNGGGD